MVRYKYKFFLDCIEAEKDVFWKNIFKECAMGKFPSNISIKECDDGSYKLYLKDKSGNNYKLPINDNFRLRQKIKDIFVNDLKILSDSEINHKKEEIKEITQSLKQKYYIWSKLNNKAKNRLLDIYMNDINHMFKLNVDQSCETLKTLLYSTHKNENIILNGDFIIDINNFKYKVIEDKLFFYLTD